MPTLETTASPASTPSRSHRPVGFVGLGKMGRPMAMNVLEAGHRLRVYNRTRAKAEPLLRAGAEEAASPADACTPGGLVVTMVSDDDALRDVTLGEDGLCGQLKGGVHVSMSTVSPRVARALAERHAEADETYLAAPVFGRPDVAEAGTLSVCVSGPAEAKERAWPLFEAMGSRLEDFGEGAGANVVKLSGNFMIAAAIEAMGEAFALVEKAGVDREQAAALFTETLFASPVYKGYGAMIAEKAYTPARFALSLGLKDVSLALGAAEEAGAPMPLAQLVRERLEASVEKRRGEVDWAGLAMEASEAAGLPATDASS